MSQTSKILTFEDLIFFVLFWCLAFIYSQANPVYISEMILPWPLIGPGSLIRWYLRYEIRDPSWWSGLISTDAQSEKKRIKRCLILKASRQYLVCQQQNPRERTPARLDGWPGGVPLTGHPASRCHLASAPRPTSSFGIFQRKPWIQLRWRQMDGICCLWSQKKKTSF